MSLPSWAVFGGVTLALGAGLAAGWWGAQKRRESGLSLLQQQLEALRAQWAEQMAAQNRTLHDHWESLSRQWSDAQKSVGDRLDHSTRVVGEVQKSLGVLSQASERIFEVGRSVAGLQDLLRAPKLRGGFGECLLEDLLGQILPPRHVERQFAFRSGAVADAVISLGGKRVAVDSKFPLENFRRLSEAVTDDDRRNARKRFAQDVRKHIEAVAQKYILPEEGTFDFAFLYVPAEAVYYELLTHDQDAALLDEALARRVIPVSPASFYAFLQAVLLGLKGLQVEENARDILAHISRLEQDMARFADDFDTLGRHLTNAESKYHESSRRLDRVRERLAVAAVAGPPTERGVEPINHTLV